MICEIKIGKSFPVSQFLISVFSAPFRLDKTGHGACIPLFVKEHAEIEIRRNKFA